ncbi:MAG: bifunctional folylpolyglutamate synthase/dihydrofolate synthase [Victivallales bacterium]|nr:bifunctional folylpolyglutamate synthase/dihydrofolate synthase [Victivallales bacterium]
MSSDSFLSGLEMFGIKMGLEQTRRLFSLMGNPEKSLRFIHVAGTNGKGSVCAMIAAGLSAAGFKTGFYSSPHLISLRERFRIDGKAISQATLNILADKAEKAAMTMKAEGASPTYFEVTTAVAAAYFAKEDVDFAVWETGMGGRLDATNIVLPEVSVITSVGMDHCDYLGSSLPLVAAEKSGIIKQGVPLFCGPMDNVAMEVIRCKAAEENTTIFLPLDNHSAVTHCNDYRLRNQTLAEAVLRHLSEKFKFPADKAFRGIPGMRWPARFHIMEDGAIVDGAHNPQGGLALAKLLQKEFPGERFSIIFAAFADKDTESLLKILEPLAERFIFTQISAKRPSAPPGQLETILQSFSKTPSLKAVNPAEALVLVPALHSSSRLLVTGSLFLAGEILKIKNLEEQALDIY